VKGKTPLGRRLREVRTRLEFEDREVFAHQLGVSKNSLAQYERGERAPDVMIFAIYAEKFGIDLTWLIAGTGQMFVRDLGPPLSPKAWTDLIHPLGRLLRRVYRDGGVLLDGDQLLAAVTRWHHVIMQRSKASRDLNELMLYLRWVEEEVRREFGFRASVER